jgi:uncharacterized membrane protein (UPF0127 family)
MSTENYLTMNHRNVLEILACALLSASLQAQEVPQTNLERATLALGMHQIDAQLALTPEQHSVGLMFRKEMPQHEGMLFIFPQASKQCFWMKNTKIALTAAFVSDDGTIANLADMKPNTTESHCSTKSVRFVLEMNQGWFAKRGFKAGARIKGPMFSE